MADDNDRRREARAPIELKVEYKRLNTFFADYTKNISRGGTFIKTSRPLSIGTEFLFKLFVPNLEQPLSIHGEVQWIVTEELAAAAGEGAEPGMGIRFVYREGDDQATRIVHHVRRAARSPRASARCACRHVSAHATSTKTSSARNDTGRVVGS